MKKLIYAGFFLAIVVTGFVGCEKEEALTETNSTKSKSDLNSAEKTLEETLETSFSNLSEYLLDRNDASDGLFFEYTMDNPDFTWEEIDSLGYADKTTLEELVLKVQISSKDMSDSDILEVAESVVSSEFIISDVSDPDSKPSAFRFCIFCCDNCMDGIKKNACYESLFWTWGPGC
jgi:hypothetical protein